MTAGLIGKKVGMTQIFSEDGVSIPVTVIEAGPCFIIQKKSTDKDGYSAIQLGFEKKEKNVRKPEAGHFKAASKGIFKRLKEFRVNDTDLGALNLGDELKADIFKVGEKVKITGFSKGRGFTGVVKRWGFNGGCDAHGSKFHRKGGSVGQNVHPGKIWKGKRMAGRYGNEQVTVKNLEVVKIYPEKNLILVKGAIPGAAGGVVYIKRSK
ncbi:MAG TPA: 50S ribosomal protein L3 [bacterium]|nr:50S ribosomal protein L3 [bacterium]